MNSSDLPYRNSREVENAKRVARRNKIKKELATKKILKNTRMHLLKIMDTSKNKEIIKKDVYNTFNKEGSYREKIRNLTEALANWTGALKEVDNIKLEKLPVVNILQPKMVPINNQGIMERIHNNLIKYNAISTNLAISKRIYPQPVKKLLNKVKLTYCPEDIILDENEIKELTKIGDTKADRYSSSRNWTVIVKKLLNIQSTLKQNDKITLIPSKASTSRIQVLKEGVLSAARPIIKIDKDKVFAKLTAANIINSKKNPASKSNIATVSDFNIIAYFNNIAHGLLSYFRCADDFYVMKSIVNWFVRYSAISTLKYKHKLSSMKTVFVKYGKDITALNHKGVSVSLIKPSYVMQLKREFLIQPIIDWTERLNKVWTSFSKHASFKMCCAVKNCSTPNDNIEMHHVKELGREIDANGYKIIKGVGKKIYGWKALEIGQKRKQTPLCRSHHHELHNNKVSLNDLLNQK